MSQIVTLRTVTMFLLVYEWIVHFIVSAAGSLERSAHLHSWRRRARQAKPLRWGPRKGCEWLTCTFTFELSSVACHRRGPVSAMFQAHLLLALHVRHKRPCFQTTLNIAS